MAKVLYALAVAFFLLSLIFLASELIKLDIALTGLENAMEETLKSLDSLDETLTQ